MTIDVWSLLLLFGVRLLLFFLIRVSFLLVLGICRGYRRSTIATTMMIGECVESVMYLWRYCASDTVGVNMSSTVDLHESDTDPLIWGFESLYPEPYCDMEVSTCTTQRLIQILISDHLYLKHEIKREWIGRRQEKRFSVAEMKFLITGGVRFHNYYQSEMDNAEAWRTKKDPTTLG